MGRHERIPRAGDTGDKHGGRGVGKDAIDRGVGGGFSAIGDKGAQSAAFEQGFGGGVGRGEFGLAEQPGLFEIDVQHGARMGQERLQAFGLAGRGRGHAQIGGGKERRPRDLFEKAAREVAVQGDEAGIGCGLRSQGAVGERLQDTIACGFERVGVGNGGDQAVGALDGHVFVGGKVGRAVDVIGDHAQFVTGAHHFVALIILADGRKQGGAQAETRQCHGDVHGHAAGQARDAAGHVRALPHVAGCAADHVPQDGTDAQDIGITCHGLVVAGWRGLGKWWGGLPGAGWRFGIRRRRRAGWRGRRRDLRRARFLRQSRKNR